MRWSPSPRAAAILAAATVALLLATTFLGARLWSASGELAARGDALDAAEADAARLAERLRRVEAHLNESAAERIRRAATLIAGPYPAIEGAVVIRDHSGTAADALRDARADLLVPTPGRRGDVLGALNASITALEWTHAALGADAMAPGDAAPRLEALGEALRNLSSAIHPHNDVILVGANLTVVDAVGSAAQEARHVATGLTHRALGAARAAAMARADILHAALVEANGTRLVRVELAAPPPTEHTHDWGLTACARGHPDAGCASTFGSGYREDGAPTGLARVEGTVAWLHAPEVTNATTEIDLRTNARVHGATASDRCTLTRDDGFTCEDPAGDPATRCTVVNDDATACKTSTLRLTMDLDGSALANGTVTGAFTLRNTGTFTRVLPMVPNATLFVAVRNASTGAPVAWFGSQFGAPEPFTDGDLSILPAGDAHTANVTFPGGWLTAPGEAYRVTAEYRPGHDEGVAAEHWTQAVRSATVTVRT